MEGHGGFYIICSSRPKTFPLRPAGYPTKTGFGLGGKTVAPATLAFQPGT